ncbi:Cytosolic phospholipase A2 gamma [Triplophysa tibetana]|uniref:Cytosolic phospholipase A2 gamma n=1 Tax=Triplophysa tibetana TaxID=1572043 RepID=A0A5A9NPS5_9TELE|nr:Cytosolic phospholipase A2 gamma [Triplophysa tibetana]
MASLYKEPDWSSRLEEVKDDIIQRLTGDGVGFMDKLSILEKYYQKDNFSLTDIWAALVINVFFEITADEVGYSMTGAFVDSSCFGCQFDEGVKKKNQPEMDMFYLQGLCGSVFADREQTMEELLILIKKLFLRESDVMCNHTSLSPPHLNEVYRVTLTLVEMNLLFFKEEDPSSHIEILNDLLRVHNDISFLEKLNKEEYETVFTVQMMPEGITRTKIQEQTLYVCQWYSDWMQKQLNYNGLWMLVIKCIELATRWIWGTTNNFLYNMTGEVSKWKERYRTFQLPYSCGTIHDLLQKAELNIENNKVDILREIQKVIKRKT